MSLLTALYSSASGLNATSNELSVVGDNISNAETVGFKASRAVFADTMTQQMVGGSGEMGLGVKTETIQKLFIQGAFTTTGNDTDVAIEGNGMFVVKGNHAGTIGTFYTRNGQFTLDKDGYLSTLDGLRVQGLVADPTGSVASGLLGDLQVGSASAPARSTDTITVRGNLDSQAAVAGAWAVDATTLAVTDPKANSNFSNSMVVYDSLGKPIQLDLYFRKNLVGDWEYHAVTDGGNLTGGTAGTPTEVANGRLTFDNQGRLVTNVSPDPTAVAATFNPINAVNPQALTFQFGSGTGATPPGSGLDGITQYASASAMSFVTQAGFTSGALSKLTIDTDGTIVGGFSNGQTRVLGQFVLGNFKAPDQLARVGATLYKETPKSGQGTLGTPATADRGSVSAGTLEQSNVDIAAEFIRMIAAQRGFQADSKTLTTADQLLGELMQVKR
jgi:flagellar hook protein FlgE